MGGASRWTTVPAGRLAETGDALAGPALALTWLSPRIEEFVDERSEILHPQRFEAHTRVQAAQLGRLRRIQRMVAGDDGHRRRPGSGVCPEAPDKFESVDRRHPQIHNDRIRDVDGDGR